MKKIFFLVTLPAHYQQVPNEDYHIHRIVNGIGEGIQDVLPMESLPFECNLDYGGGGYKFFLL